MNDNNNISDYKKQAHSCKEREGGKHISVILKMKYKAVFYHEG